MKKFDLIIKGGTIVTAGESYRSDIAVKDGAVACIGENPGEAEQVIDAAGRYVLPGAVDIHTHIDAPLHGSHTMDDWYQGTYTGAFGGVTCIVDYPMQAEGQGIGDLIMECKEKAGGRAVVDYSFSPVITQRTEEVYAEIPKLIAAGYPTFKVFMAYAFRARDEELARLLDVISKNGGLLGVHAENDWVIEYMAKKMVAEGKTEPKYHPLSRPPVSEEEATGRVARIAEMIGAPVLVVHVSAKGALEEIEKAKRRGVAIYAETCPHFLLLDERVYDQPIEEAAKFVVTPPIRSEEHRQALWRGLADGAISLVSSDHCAFSLKEKLRLGTGDFTKIPHGAPGVETRVPLLFSEGVLKGRITPERFVELVSTAPAKLAGLYPRKGTLAVGSDADIMILDPLEEREISVETLRGVCDFTPFQGFKVKGWPKTVLCRGNLIVSEGELVASPGWGRLIRRSPFKVF